MKIIVLFFLFFVPIGAFSQTLSIDPQTKAISYEEIVRADSINALEILKLAKRWAIDTYGAGKEMIEYYDENDRMMVIKPVFKATTPFAFNFFLTKVITYNTYIFYCQLEVETKDNRYRITAKNFLGTLKQENSSAIVPTKMEADKLLFYNEEVMRAGAKVAFPGRERKQEEYLQAVKKEKEDVQLQFDQQVKETFRSLKDYIAKPKKKDW